VFFPAERHGFDELRWCPRII